RLISGLLCPEPQGPGPGQLPHPVQLELEAPAPGRSEPVGLLVAGRIFLFGSLDPPVGKEPPQCSIERARAHPNPAIAEGLDVFDECVPVARRLGQAHQNQKDWLSQGLTPSVVRLCIDMSHADILALWEWIVNISWGVRQVFPIRPCGPDRPALPRGRTPPAGLPLVSGWSPARHRPHPLQRGSHPWLTRVGHKM